MVEFCVKGNRPTVYSPRRVDDPRNSTGARSYIADLDPLCSTVTFAVGNYQSNVESSSREAATLLQEDAGIDPRMR